MYFQLYSSAFFHLYSILTIFFPIHTKLIQMHFFTSEAINDQITQLLKAIFIADVEYSVYLPPQSLRVYFQFCIEPLYSSSLFEIRVSNIFVLLS